LSPVIREALADASTTLDEIDSIAVTQGPGLVGALLVGIATAKAIAWSRRTPLVPVDHLDGHIASLYLQPDPLEPPFLCLLASGGHTMLLEVRTHRGSGSSARRSTMPPARPSTRARASSASATPAAARSTGSRGPATRARTSSRSPAFRARLLLLRPQDGAALRDARPRAARARAQKSRPRGLVSARYREGPRRAHATSRRALGDPPIAVVGGVAANTELRAALAEAALAPLELTTDNAAMIASAARFADPVPYPGYLDLDAYASR
jgi:N6-L-threonylcarbamoyladenine synthase